MADPEDWTADDDARLRAALTSLRTDVEAAPLPDVRFVKARGRALRRRRFLTVGAAAAAAFLVAGTVGYAALDREPDQGTVAPPAARSTTTSATPSPTIDDSLDIPGFLPVDGEWQDALGLPAGSVKVTPVTKDGGVECGPAFGAPKAQISGPVQGVDSLTVGGAYWPAADQKGAEAKTATAIESCENGPNFSAKKERVSNAVIYSYVAGEAGVGWYAVVTGGQGVALLNVSENGVAKSRFTADQLEALATAAQARLDRYATTTSSPITTKGGGSSTKAVNEKMPVTGPDPVPSSGLFVAASQWASTALTGGEKTSAGPGALEGSTTIASCETDEQQAGIGGSVGVVSVRTGSGQASYIGRQRVQVDQSSERAVQKNYVSARLQDAQALFIKGCSVPNATVRATKGPTEGTFRLDTVFADGTPTLSEWVGVTAQRTPGAVTTIVVTKVAEPGQAFAELDRLLALARQK